jgi:DNA-binding CsgD family transcriptional regulator
MIKETLFRHLTRLELQHVMDTCAQLHMADPDESFLHHCHATLDPLLSNVHFSAEIYEVSPLQLREQEIHTLDDEYWIPLFLEHLHDHPYAQRLSGSAGTEVGMTHREPSLKKFRKSALYNEFYGRVEAQNQLWVGIRDGHDLLNCVYSREKEYTENQLAMLCLIQPQLETSWKNWKRARILKRELDRFKKTTLRSEESEAVASRMRKLLNALTPRQRDVVELLASGKDNQQIADELQISVLTVKKHLQAVFQSLEVQHRTELAAKWHQAHSIQRH